MYEMTPTCVVNFRLRYVLRVIRLLVWPRLMTFHLYLFILIQFTVINILYYMCKLNCKQMLQICWFKLFLTYSALRDVVNTAEFSRRCGDVFSGKLHSILTGSVETSTSFSLSLIKFLLPLSLRIFLHWFSLLAVLDPRLLSPYPDRLLRYLSSALYNFLFIYLFIHSFTTSIVPFSSGPTFRIRKFRRSVLSYN